MPSKYDPETRAKAVRLVREHRESQTGSSNLTGQCLVRDVGVSLT